MMDEGVFLDCMSQKKIDHKTCALRVIVFLSFNFTQHVIMNDGLWACQQLNIVFFKTIFLLNNLYLTHARQVIMLEYSSSCNIVKEQGSNTCSYKGKFVL